jgi:hypothetical protein
MNWKPWLHSLVAAAIGGAATSLGAALVTSNYSWQQAWHMALVGAAIPVLALLKQSPLPSVVTVTTTETVAQQHHPEAQVTTTVEKTETGK